MQFRCNKINIAEGLLKRLAAKLARQVNKAKENHVLHLRWESVKAEILSSRLTNLPETRRSELIVSWTTNLWWKQFWQHKRLYRGQNVNGTTLLGQTSLRVYMKTSSHTYSRMYSLWISYSEYTTWYIAAGFIYVYKMWLYFICIYEVGGVVQKQDEVKMRVLAKTVKERVFKHGDPVLRRNYNPSNNCNGYSAEIECIDDCIKGCTPWT